MRGIELLHPKLQEKAKQLEELCAQRGLPFKTTETFRTALEQDLLYAQGRTSKGSIVTNAKGASFSSGHQWGVAFDFARSDTKDAYDESDRIGKTFFADVGELGESIGLIWGGRWKKPDRPHFELAEFMPNNSTKMLRETYKVPDKFKDTWGVTSNISASRNLSFGCKGNEVAELQKALNKYGNKLHIDGNFGSKTSDAVRVFQKRNGLTVDGIVGPKTKELLGIK
jgi:peptidoglycan L-alanyl-D-glutamate endopeptidase CwlK